MHTYSTLSKWLPYRFTTIESKYRREESGDRKGRGGRDRRKEREEREERHARGERGER